MADRAPKEPPVHALLGQLYHRRGDLRLALRHLNIAVDLDPKEGASLKVGRRVVGWVGEWVGGRRIAQRLLTISFE